MLFPEEVLPVLRKWRSNSRRVRAVAQFRAQTPFSITIMLEGRLQLHQADSMLMIVSSDGSKFAVKFAGSMAGFTTSADPEMMQALAKFTSPEKIEEIVVFRDLSGAKVCLFSLTTHAAKS